MTPSKSQIFIVDKIEFNEEITTANLILNGLKAGELDLTICDLKKLDRTDGNMEYYEVIERTAQEVPVQEQSLSNFSPQTGIKLHETCPKCWVKNKPYNCGFDKCPGYKLLVQNRFVRKETRKRVHLHP